MRIVIDMQGAQSTGSRDRGVGRYTRSLVLAMARQARDIEQVPQHELVLAFNNEFADTVTPLRSLFAGLVAPEHFVVWHTDGFTPYLANGQPNERLAAQLAYEAFLLSHNPDIILTTSLFEGLVDPTITSIHRYQHEVPVASILYDLIPYTNPALYLENPMVNDWYHEKLQDLRQADLLLSISAYSRQEAIDELALGPDKVLNISSDVDGSFKPVEFDHGQEIELRQRLGLPGDFVMYTGGADHRKNLEGLIRAFSALPDDLKDTTELAIVCAMPEAMSDKLLTLATQLGLRSDALVLTGFVSEEDLRGLYTLSTLFVFPSFQEGFGLPALEAMRCGAPVIGSNRSSIPEVVGCPDALFDPRDINSITQLLARGLADTEFRESLLTRQAEHAKQFSWDLSAKRALTAMSEVVSKSKPVRAMTGIPTDRSSAPNSQRKPKLAFFSPLPDAKSGIAGYSAMLLPSLAQHYDIELIVQQDEPVNDSWIQANLPIRDTAWFAEHFELFDRVVYQFGNSTFHRHMFEWLTRVPGVVVLHDFFLSGILADNELRSFAPGAWTHALYHSHGYEAVAMRLNEPDLAQTIWQYPANLSVLQQALGVIVHTEHARDLARHWYGKSVASDWQVIPLVRSAPQLNMRQTARLALGLTDKDFLVCSFGGINPTKLNLEILQAWDESLLAEHPNARLVFVGEQTSDQYGKQIQTVIDQRTRQSQVEVSGWVDSARYDQYLQAADLAIQLRTKSRGETSAAVLDCMNYGIATIVNAHGSMQALDPSAVKLIADEFAVAELTSVINDLVKDETLRQALGQSAAELTRTQHSPQACASSYVQAIEGFYHDRRQQLPRLCGEIAKLKLDDTALLRAAHGLAKSFAPKPREPRCLLDVTHLVNTESKPQGQVLQAQALDDVIQQWHAQLPNNLRLEPIYADPLQTRFCFAQRATCQRMRIPDHWAEDETVQPWPGDMVVTFEENLETLGKKQSLLQAWRNQTNNVWLVLGHSSVFQNPAQLQSLAAGENLLDCLNGVVCQTPEQLETVHAALMASFPSRAQSLKLCVGLPQWGQSCSGR